MENIPSGIISRVPLPPCATVVDDWFLAHMDGRSLVNTTPPVLVVAFEIILMHIIIYFKKIHGHWILTAYAVIANISSFWYKHTKQVNLW